MTPDPISTSRPVTSLLGKPAEHQTAQELAEQGSAIQEPAAGNAVGEALLTFFDYFKELATSQMKLVGHISDYGSFDRGAAQEILHSLQQAFEAVVRSLVANLPQGSSWAAARVEGEREGCRDGN
ncbi:hypothetical protein LWI28_003883 [Acer negundo]|uniref:Uncharacterized protein n=1 Tax=Acer negundo TaxID=4023 RepID=A0AAD5NTZ6_ACENE|nr:hypothetical protein LWI28_003883 [Acer negundo]